MSNLTGNPAKRANPGLDQLAAQIRNDRRGRHPVIVGLEPLEQQLLEVFTSVGGEQVDPAQAGATALILGQLLADLVPKLPSEQQHEAPAIIINLMRMIGQRLYGGEAEPQMRCPFTLPHGAPCKFEPKVSMGGTLTSVMQGHVALHHPGETWPPADVDEDQADEDEAVRECAECHFEVPVVFTADGLVTLSHPIDGTAFECPGSEQPPVHRVMTSADVDQAMHYGVCEKGHARTVRTTHTSAGGATEMEMYCPTCDRTAGQPSHYVDAGMTDLVELRREADGSLVEVITPTGAHMRLEPGFDAEGNITELSIVTDGQRHEVAPPANVLRVPADQCTHPRHARMHLPGGERCCACGSPIKPDEKPDAPDA